MTIQRYQIALRLLRSGATVIAVTRFPHDAAKRYSNESDYENWKEKLRIKKIIIKPKKKKKKKEIKHRVIIDWNRYLWS